MNSIQKYKTTRVHLKPSDVVTAIERIKKKITNKPITYVYLVVYETSVSGAWVDPEKAIEYCFKYELKKNKGIYLGYDEQLFTVQEAVKKMLEPNTDYPYLAKIKLNPVNDNEIWDLPR